MNALRPLAYIFLLLFPVFLTAQSEKKKSTSTVYINQADCSVSAEILLQKSTFKPESEVVYSWYAYNKIMDTKGGYDGKLLHGTYTSFYLNNNLREKGKYKKGVRTGEWISWHENGNKKEVSYWKNGLKNGISTLYHMNGDLAALAPYKQGQLHGTVKNYANHKLIDAKKYRYGVEVDSSSSAKPKKTMRSDSTSHSPKDTLQKPEKKAKGLAMVKEKKTKEKKPSDPASAAQPSSRKKNETSATPSKEKWYDRLKFVKKDKKTAPNSQSKTQ
jgi:hypothetical protein